MLLCTPSCCFGNHSYLLSVLGRSSAAGSQCTLPAQVCCYCHAMSHLGLPFKSHSFDEHPVCAGAALLQPHQCLPHIQMQAQSASGCAKPSQHWPNQMLSWTSLQRSSLRLVSLCDAYVFSELIAALLLACLAVSVLPASALSSKHIRMGVAVQSDFQCKIEQHLQQDCKELDSIMRETSGLLSFHLLRRACGVGACTPV